MNPSTTPGYSIRLNGSDNERNGIARSLSVMPGDKIDMQVFGKYYDPNTPQANQTAWDNLVGLITQVTNAAQTVVVDGVGYTSGSLRVPPATGVLTDPNENVAYPKAHLNWATFDRDWKFLDGGAKQLQGGAEDGTDVPFAEISKSIEIKEPGYVYIWLSNTSTQVRDVFFDDFKVVHTKSPIVQQEEYYPFGLTFNSYQRENIVPQNYLYNKKELINDLSLGVYDYGARQYDPAIGRWTVIDPLSEKYLSISPYAYVADNPIKFVDPNGKEIEWASYRQVKKDPVLSKQFSSRREYREARREAKSAYNNLIKESSTAKEMFKKLDESKDVHTIYASKSGNSNTVAKTGDVKGTNITVGLGGKFSPGVNDRETNTMTSVAHEGAHALRMQNGLDKSLPSIDLMNPSIGSVLAYNRAAETGERGASHIENIIRGELISGGRNVELRSEYTTALPRVDFNSNTGKFDLGYDGVNFNLLNGNPYNSAGYLNHQYSLGDILK